MPLGRIARPRQSVSQSASQARQHDDLARARTATQARQYKGLPDSQSRQTAIRARQHSGIQTALGHPSVAVSSPIYSSSPGS
eukprot:3041666-Pyramimonas_sp.AAC.1